MTRVYLAGAGVIARQHAAAIPRLPEPERVELFVADPSAAVLGDFMQQVPHARPFDSVEAMLADPPAPGDIVIVAAPPFAHLDIARQAFERGRHVLCEKPLAMTIDQARELLDLARRHDRLLGCCSTRFLGLPTTAEVRRLIATGALGQLYHLTFMQREHRSRPGIEYQPASRWFLDRSKSGGGPLIDWGPYDFAALNDLLEPTRVDVLSAWMSRPVTAADPHDVVFDIEEHIGASLRYHLADGAVVHVTYERAACTHGEPVDRMELEGTTGAVRWDWRMWGGKGTLSHTVDRDGQPATETATFVADDGLRFNDRPLAYFWRRIHDQPSPALINERAVFNYACIQAIYACANSGQPQTVTRDW